MALTWICKCFCGVLFQAQKARNNYCGVSLNLDVGNFSAFLVSCSFMWVMMGDIICFVKWKLTGSRQNECRSSARREWASHRRREITWLQIIVPAPSLTLWGPCWRWSVRKWVRVGAKHLCVPKLALKHMQTEMGINQSAQPSIPLCCIGNLYKHEEGYSHLACSAISFS
jgi:hypothetical protein